MDAVTDGIVYVFYRTDGGDSDRTHNHNHNHNHCGPLGTGAEPSAPASLVRMGVDAMAEAEAARERARSLIVSARIGEQLAAVSAAAPGAREQRHAPVRSPRIRRLPLVLFCVLVAGSLLLLVSRTVAEINGLVDGRTTGWSVGGSVPKAPAAGIGSDHRLIR